MSLQSLKNAQAIMEHLNRDECDIAFQKAHAMMSKEKSKDAFMHYAIALCYYKNGNNDKASGHLNMTLSLDPSFVSAAELLLSINKHVYSLGELKYLYTLIISHKKGNEEMYRFLDQFSSTPINPHLSVGKIESVKNVSSLVEDNSYIDYLVTEMDKDEQDKAKNYQAACHTADTTLFDGSLPKPEAFKAPSEAPSAKTVPFEESDSQTKASQEPRDELETQVETINKTPVEPKPAAKAMPTSFDKVSFLSEVKNKETKANKAKTEIKNYGIETLTMARLYIRQGLYEQAMGILMKLIDQKPDDENIKIEIDNLQVLMRDKSRG
ncbi:MAG: tetratricopeptide repeat protein [Candidatus Neomarinimicrobiota bacterium]